MSEASCDHFGAVRWPRVSELACSVCELRDEALIADLGLDAPLAPTDWQTIRGGLAGEDWAAIEAELPGAVARARAAKFLDGARVDTAQIKQLTPAGRRWSVFALGAEKAGPKLDKALKHAIARTREALSAIESLEKVTHEAWRLAEVDVPFIEDPAAPTVSFDAEKDFLVSVGFLLLQRYHAAFFAGLASNTPKDLRPSSPKNFIVPVFVPVSPREHVVPLTAAARCLARIYQVALVWTLDEDSAKTMIADGRRLWTAGALVVQADSDEEPTPLNPQAVTALRHLARSSRPAMERLRSLG